MSNLVTVVFALLFCGLIITHAATEVSARCSHTIEPDRFGSWGNWGKAVFCHHGFFATAFELKVENYQGCDGDNSALNAVKLYCNRHCTITSTQGPWGNWQGKRTCLNGQYLDGFRMRNERALVHSRADNSAANDIQMRCRVSGQTLYAGGHNWGRWSSWTSCHSGYAICGLQTKVEPYLGVRDDTALNSVRFYCCKVPKV